MMPDLVTPEIDFDFRRPLGFLQRCVLTAIGATASESKAKGSFTFDRLTVTRGDLSA
jgi:hypothetical protein